MSQILGSGKKRLWNTSMVLLPDYENLRWVGKLDKLGFEVSTGSACSVGKKEGSGIVNHYGLTAGQGRRLSSGKFLLPAKPIRLGKPALCILPRIQGTSQ